MESGEPVMGILANVRSKCTSTGTPNGSMNTNSWKAKAIQLTLSAVVGRVSSVVRSVRNLLDTLEEARKKHPGRSSDY